MFAALGWAETELHAWHRHARKHQDRLQQSVGRERRAVTLVVASALRLLAAVVATVVASAVAVA